MFSLIGWLIVGGLAGWIASMIMGTNERQGCLANVLLGILGAVIGGFLLGLLGIGGGAGYQGFNALSLISAVVGAVVLLFLKRQLTGPART